MGYFTGSLITVNKNLRTTSRKINNYAISIRGLNSSYQKNTNALVRLHIFDQNDPFVKSVKIPVELPGVVVKNAYYQIRDHVTNEIIVPFDDVKNSTKISSDSEGMFFTIDTSNLSTGRAYIIDVMISKNGTKTHYNGASPVFSISIGDEIS